MQIKWKNRKKLKPSVVLDRINSVKIIKSDGGVSFSGFEFHEYMATLQSMVAFPACMDLSGQESIVSRAVFNVAKQKDLDEKSVLSEIINIRTSELAQCEHCYRVLTAISLKSPYPTTTIHLEGSKIRLLDSPFPKKYVSRDQLIEERGSVSDSTPATYAKVIVNVKSKSKKGAIGTALRVLDIQRAVWCLLGNSKMEVWGDNWLPINRIRLGAVHTLHNVNGTNATDMFWYEPNFVTSRPFSPSDIDQFQKNSQFFFSQLDKSSYSLIIKESLLRYVRALDEKDQNTALLKLWGALEVLTVPNNGKCDLLVRRCSFLFKDREYHRQALEHLREYRNCSVHAGEQDERAKTNCFQLQYYYYRLVIFHLNNAEQFESLEEANSFLDLSNNKDCLDRQRWLLDKAIVFVS